MRTTTRILLFVLLFLSAVAGGAWGLAPVAAVHISPSGHPTTDLGFFFDDLAPYGTWLQSPANGWVWTPSAVAPAWHPYELGHWSLTDQGWMWMSDEPFGWATYHYGRWYDDPDIGWAWVPGYEWAPSWVSFQESPSYVGWAPLPPALDLRVPEPRFALAPDTFLFVPKRSFLAPRVVDFVVPPARALPIFRTTRTVTRYRFAGDRVFTYGVPVQRLQPAIGRPVPLYRLADVGPAPRLRPARIVGDRIGVFRPEVRKVRVTPPPFRLASRHAVISRTEFQKTRVRGVSRGPWNAPKLHEPARVRTLQVHPNKAVHPKDLRPAARMKSRVAPRPQRVHGGNHGPRMQPAQRIHPKGARIQHGKAGGRVQHGKAATRVRVPHGHASRMRMPAGSARRPHVQAGPQRQRFQAGPRRQGGPGGHGAGGHGGGKRRP